jgi:hypothetical protein
MRAAAVQLAMPLPMPLAPDGSGPAAVLCVSPNSIYRELAGVEAFDMRRDARTFLGGAPIVAHPPCRSWSAFCAHQAKPGPGERELALWCIEQLRVWGGVLEQPAHSRLWAAAGIPAPGAPAVGGVFSLQVDQSWWGMSIRKRHGSRSSASTAIRCRRSRRPAPARREAVRAGRV